MRRLLLFVLSVGAWGQTQTYVLDTGASDGATGGTASIISNPTPALLAQKADLSYRYGNFSYDTPVANVPYVITFNWIEMTVTKAGQRLFQVQVNDRIAFDKLDLFAICGYMQQCSRTFIVVPSMGKIHIAFITQVRNAVVQNIKIEPMLRRLSPAFQ